MLYQTIGIIENVKKAKAIALQAELLQRYPKQMILIQKPADVLTCHPDLLLVLGGDGFLLYVLHQYAKFNLPFYGINCGNIGFLLNKYNTEDDLLQLLEHAVKSQVVPLKNKIIDIHRQEYIDFAFNELSLLRNTHQAIRIRIEINGITRVEKLIADGLVLSTPLGSTSYNYSLGGPILPLSAPLISLIPNSTFRPRFWRGALLSFEDMIQLDILDAEERSLNATVDYQEYTNIKQIHCSVATNQAVQLLFNADLPLAEKTIREQFADIFYTQNFLNNTNEF